jgi:penicillin-binding protein 1A
MWMDYMGKVLKGVPEAVYSMPANMVAARINNSGLRDANGEITEYFYQENLPPEQSASPFGQAVKDQLF